MLSEIISGEGGIRLMGLPWISGATHVQAGRI
jgi:hypothetical protein